MLTASFVPPPHEVAAQALSTLEKFFHEDDHIPPLIKIGLAHAQFETIHPFLDGNGRVGRLLITFFLYEKQLLIRPVLYLSHYFKAHRQEYYERLQATRVDGDWESWIKFFLKGVGDVSEQATETARQIVSLREEHRALIAEKFGNSAGKAHRVLEHLYRRPTVSINNIRDELGISFPNASALVDKFVENSMLFEMTGQARNRRFLYAPYISLFSNL